MAHSKRNTSLAFFTAHERAELKGVWGSRATRLTRESFLPLGSCQLCLEPAREPVSCPTQGHLFCRECAINNLLAQSKELKRLKKEVERRKVEEEEERQIEDAEAEARALEEFEKVQAGLSVRSRGSGRTETVVGRANGKVLVEREGQGEGASGAHGTKRKLIELDEAELLRLADEDRERTKRLMREEERTRKPELPSFWVPSETPDNKRTELKALKLHPTCPASASDADRHDFSLKTLITVHFHQEPRDGADSSTGQSTTRICPSCAKPLTNATKAMLARPCGHVLCKLCSDRFQKPAERSAHDAEHDATVRCYVCQEDITPGGKRSKRQRDEGGPERESRVTRGLVELSSEGTGFAGGGKNMVRKQGVAFQC